MATSLLMSNTNKEEINHQPSMRRSTGRRKSKNSCCSSSSSKNEKQKQRGMGVEKLERLIAQERWKQMTEMNTDASVVRDHRGTAPNSDTVMMINASAQNMLPMKFGHLGFHPQRFVGGGFSAPSFLAKNVNLATGIDVPEHCSLCNKKKWVVDGENLGAVRSDMFKKMSNNFGDAGNFLGLRCGDNDRTYHVINSQENINFGSIQTKPPLMPLVGSYAVTNAKQGVEIVAVHKKGSREDGNNTVLMEYEFFPSPKKVTSDRSHQLQNDDDDDDDDDDLVMMRMMTNNMKSSSSEASCSCKGCDYQCNCCGIDASSGSIDLSLKLSY